MLLYYYYYYYFLNSRFPLASSLLCHGSIPALIKPKSFFGCQLSVYGPMDCGRSLRRWAGWGYYPPLDPRRGKKKIKKKIKLSSVRTTGLKHERSSHSYVSSRATIKLTFTAHISLIGVLGCDKCDWTLNAAILVKCFAIRPSPFLPPLASPLFSHSVQPTVLFYNFICVNECSVSDVEHI